MKLSKTTSLEKQVDLSAITGTFKGSDNKTQCARLLEALARYPITTFEAMRYLDVYHCPARVLELRKLGHNITTHWQTVETEAMRPRGWNSNGTISRALLQLKESGLLIETRMGMRPNRAAWFALGWQSLDETSGLDIDPRSYRTGQYKIAALTPIKGDYLELVRRLRGLRIARAERNLKAGRAQAWTREYFEKLGLYRLRGTIRYLEKPSSNRGQA